VNLLVYEWQVINHGVSLEAVEKMLGVAHDFFSLPVEEKLKLYSDDPSKTMRLSTSFNVNKEKVHNWRDYLRLHCYPLDKYAPEWPSKPPPFKWVLSLSLSLSPPPPPPPPSPAKNTVMQNRAHHKHRESYVSDTLGACTSGA